MSRDNAATLYEEKVRFKSYGWAALSFIVAYIYARFSWYMQVTVFESPGAARWLDQDFLRADAIFFLIVVGLSVVSGVWIVVSVSFRVVITASHVIVVQTGIVRTRIPMSRVTEVVEESTAKLKSGHGAGFGWLAKMWGRPAVDFSSKYLRARVVMALTGGDVVVIATRNPGQMVDLIKEHSQQALRSETMGLVEKYRHST